MQLLRSRVVRCLADDWRETLDRLAEERGWPTSREPARLAALVARLSTAYNTGDLPRMRAKEALAPRLGFSFARDAPKSAGAARELVATGALDLSEGRALRVLDLGAGLGASTWGLAMALAAWRRDASARVEAVCVDEDPAALSIAAAIADARRGRGALEVRIETARAPIERGAREAEGPFDVVLLGQVLSELPAGLEARIELVRAALERAGRSGSVVIIEPALRARARSLHALRDALLGDEAAPSVFAPCVHAAPCPALAHEGDWCHEDLDVDLPAWLAPVAAAAGLRWQGLTFSYLVLRNDGRTLRGLLPAQAVVRVVSGPIVTKGKREAFVCGEAAGEEGLAPRRARMRLLDRDIGSENRAWGDVARGDLLACEPPLDAARARIGADATLARVTPDRDGG